MSFPSRSIRSLLRCEMSVERFTLECMWKEIYICFDFALLVLLCHSTELKPKSKAGPARRVSYTDILCTQKSLTSNQRIYDIISAIMQ